jgi:hypothetical protein
LAVAVPNEKIAAIKYGASTAGLRPYTSDRGAHTSGPKPKPNKSKVVPRVDTSTETPYWSATCI